MAVRVATSDMVGGGWWVPGAGWWGTGYRVGVRVLAPGTGYWPCTGLIGLIGPVLALLARYWPYLARYWPYLAWKWPNLA